jgi:hypothetical protein
MAIELRDHLFNSGAALVLHGNRGLSDADFAQLLDFAKEEKASITDVVVSRTGITGECFRHLACLPNLKALYANNTPIGDDAPLECLPASIEIINLDGTHVGDVGVSKLRLAPNLCSVRLRNTNITSRGVEILASMPRLRDCHVDGADLSDHTRQRLNNAMVLSAATFAGSIVFLMQKIGYELGKLGSRLYSARPSWFTRLASPVRLRS